MASQMAEPRTQTQITGDQPTSQPHDTPPDISDLISSKETCEAELKKLERQLLETKTRISAVEGVLEDAYKSMS